MAKPKSAARPKATRKPIQLKIPKNWQYPDPNVEHPRINATLVLVNRKNRQLVNGLALADRAWLDFLAGWASYPDGYLFHADIGHNDPVSLRILHTTPNELMDLIDAARRLHRFGAIEIVDGNYHIAAGWRELYTDPEYPEGATVIPGPRRPSIL